MLLPTVMRALNDYRMPLFMYTQAPLVGAGGLTVFNARLAAAFWGILTLAALYRLGKEWFNRRIALASMGFLAISPWTVPLNRIALEANTTVPAALLTVGLFWQWRRTGRFRFLIGAALMAGLGLYTYSTISLFLALMLTMLTIVSLREVRARWRECLVAAALGLLLTLPLLYHWARYPDGMGARYREIAVFRPERQAQEALGRFLRHVWYNVSPNYLFVRGDLDILEHPGGIGQLYHVQAVLIPLGWIAGWQRKTWRLPLLLTVGWVVASVIPVALTEPNLPGSGHALRGLPGVVPWQLWSGIGVEALSTRKRTWKPILLSLVAVWVAVSATLYFREYFTAYPRVVAHRLSVEMPDLAVAVSDLSDSYEHVYITCYSTWPYLYLLFFTRYDPHLLQEDLPVRGNELFAPVSRLGKYHIICDILNVWNSGEQGLFVVPLNDPPDAQPLQVICGPSGKPCYKILARP
ncbi:MAG: glycosyltransferase family 39 protein [Anaerolineae bacterium]|nr:glycosyltransferase family 39 protein [Anaerolineae bacterium]